MANQDELFLNIIKGNFDNLPNEKSNIVRIFFSSTFADTYAERDYLIEKVYPKLKNYCKTQYGLDFQIIDMRWGISSEANIDHTTTDICLNEIRDSKKDSIGPYFIAFLSHRYGTRDLPNRIVEDEFETFKEEIKSASNIDLTFKSNLLDLNVDIKNILEECYRLDENEVPKKYKLLNIDEILTGYNDTPEHKKIWMDLSDKIGSALRKIANSCFEKELIKLSDLNKYFVSITEKEIELGILEANDVEDNVIYFERKIKPIENYHSVDEKLLRKYFDIDSNGNIDKEAEMLLNDLKTKKLRKKLPRKNIIEFEVDLQQGISYETHKKYIDDFSQKFEESVKQLVDKNAQKKYFTDKFNQNDRILMQEIITHAKFSKECVQKFHGRVDYINKVIEYITSDSRIPFVISGDSGSGKTSIIAKVTGQLFNSIKEPENYYLILRFLGTTPGTSNIMSTFKSIINQIDSLLQQETVEKTFSTTSDIKNYLYEKILQFSQKYPTKKLVILLDSIDQLINSDYDLQWMIYEFPSNVKLVLSTLENHGGIHNILLKRIVNNNNHLNIKPLNLSNVKTILEDWLSKTNRSLSEEQWQMLDDIFKKSTLQPLYVKLIFDIVIKWRSFYKPDNEFFRINKIDNCIKYLFKLLEKEHGKVLFSRCIYYMSIMKNGITENELEDILSLDDDLLSNIFEFHSPPIRRFPIALWARIKHVLKEYLVEKEINDAKVTFWYHRRFIEVSKSFYVDQNEGNKNCLENIIDYFTGKWKTEKKPFKHNEYYAKKKNIPLESEACRYVNDQPTVFVSENGEKRPNKRKLIELPHIINKLEPNKSADAVSQYYVFDYEFLYNKFKYDDLENLIDEIVVPFKGDSSIYKTKTIHELRLFMFVFLSSMYTIHQNANNLSIEVLSRCLMFYNFLESTKRLIDGADKYSFEHCALVVPYQYLNPPGSGSFFTLDTHKTSINSKILDRTYFITCSDHMNIFSVAKFYSIGEIKYPVLKASKDGRTKQEAIKLTVVYLEERPDDDNTLVKEFLGGYILMTDTKIMSFKLDETLYFKHEFSDSCVESMFVIPDKFLVVEFKEKSFYDIYNLYTGERIARYDFDKKIKFMLSSCRNDVVSDFSRIVDKFLIIAFEKGEIHKYKFESDKPKLVYKIQANNFEFLSGNYLFDAKDQTDIRYITSEYIVTLENGGFCMFSENDSATDNTDYNGSILFVDTILENVSRNKSLQIKFSNQNGVLFADANGNLYLFNKTDKMIRCFPGDYQVARLIGKNLIMASSNGSIFTCYIPTAINTDSKNHKVLPLLKFTAHFEEVTYLNGSDDIALTVSKDNTLKFFVLPLEYKNTEVLPKFDHSSFKQNKIFHIGNDNVLVYSENSRGFDIWKCNAGTIELHHDLNMETIKNIVVVENAYFVLGQQYFKQENATKYVAKVLTQEKSNANLNETFRTVYRDANNCHLIKTNTNSIAILTETIEKSSQKIKLYLIEYLPNAKSNPFSLTTIENFNEIIKSKSIDNQKLSSFGISRKTGLLLLAFDLQLYLIDVKAKKLVTSMIMNKSAEIKKTDGFKLDKIEPIDNTDDFIAVSNSSQIFYISFEQKQNSINIVTKSDLVISKFDMKNNILALAELTMIEDNDDSKHFRLFVYKMNQIKSEKSFQNPIMILDLHDLEHFCLSPDTNYLALFEKPKHLSLYRLKDSKRCAYIHLYSDIYSMVITDQFVSLGMKDRRVLSYLIVDPLEKDHFSRISKLPSRLSKQESEESIKRLERLTAFTGGGMQNMQNTAKVHDELFKDDSNLKFTAEEEKLRNKIQSYPVVECVLFERDPNKTTNEYFNELNGIIKNELNNASENLFLDTKEDTPAIETIKQDNTNLSQGEDNMNDEELVDFKNHKSSYVCNLM